MRYLLAISKTLVISCLLLSLWNSGVDGAATAAGNQDGGASRRGRFHRSKLENICDVPFVSERLLGSGVFGNADLVEFQGRKAVLKTIKPEMDNEGYIGILFSKKFPGIPNHGRRTRRKFESEIKIHRKLSSHPNIVSLIGACATRGEQKILLSFASGGTLKDYLQAHEYISLETKFKILLGLARALRFVERSGYIHTDATAANILMESNGTPKLADFGIALRRDKYDQPLRDLGYYYVFGVLALEDKPSPKLETRKARMARSGASDPSWLSNLKDLITELSEDKTSNPMEHVVEYLENVKEGRVQRRSRKSSA